MCAECFEVEINRFIEGGILSVLELATEGSYDTVVVNAENEIIIGFEMVAGI